MMLPFESHQAFTDLDASWAADFPGKSRAMLTLREDIVRADWLRRRARAILDQLCLDLDLTGLPMACWDSFTQKQFHFLEKHAAQTQQEFRKAFQLILSFKPVAAKPEPASAAPTPPQRDYRPIFQQTVEISVEGGKTVTKASHDARFFLRPDVLAKAGGMWRLFYFNNKVVPPEYAYVLEHDGVRHQPTQSIFISYKPEDFKDICQRELETESQHLLDGKRWGYKHI